MHDAPTPVVSGECGVPCTLLGQASPGPLAGQPIPNLDQPHDELWWVKHKLRREGLTYMSPSAALRKRTHDALQSALGAKSEADVREIITDINVRDWHEQPRG